MVFGKSTGQVLADRFREDLEFFIGWAKKPGLVGSITPTGKVAARHMASLLPIETGLPVLELGPGTGVITQEILKRGLAPEKLVSIECSAEFYAYLVEKFPGVNFVNADAFDLDNALDGIPYETYAGVIGAVPLLNVSKPLRNDIIIECLKRVVPGGPFIQISYGPNPPTKAVPGKFTVEKSDRIFRNIPPAGIWVYRKDTH